MLNFYVSLRPIKIGSVFLTGHEHIQHSFKGLDVACKVLASDFNKDGRILCEVVIGSNSSYTDQECQDYKAILMEGLQLFSVHEKSLSSAQSLAETLTEKSWSNDGSKLIPPARGE